MDQIQIDIVALTPKQLYEKYKGRGVKVAGTIGFICGYSESHLYAGLHNYNGSIGVLEDTCDRIYTSYWDVFVSQLPEILCHQ